MGAAFREEYNGSETGYTRMHGENDLNSVVYMCLLLRLKVVRH